MVKSREKVGGIMLLGGGVVIGYTLMEIVSIGGFSGLYHLATFLMGVLGTTLTICGISLSKKEGNK